MGHLDRLDQKDLRVPQVRTEVLAKTLQGTLPAYQDHQDHQETPEHLERTANLVLQEHPELMAQLARAFLDQLGKLALRDLLDQLEQTEALEASQIQDHQDLPGCLEIPDQLDPTDHLGSLELQVNLDQMQRIVLAHPGLLS